MENSKTEPVVDKASSLSVNFEKFESLGLEVMIFFCNVKAKELLPKYCGTQGMMNAAKNTELGKKFVNEFLECCQEINAQKKKKVDIKQEVDSSLADNMTLDMSVEEVVNEAVITRIKEEEFSEASESVITEKDAEPSGKVNEYMWSQMLSNFVHMVGEYENTKRDENLSGTGSMSANKGETDTEPKDEHCGVKIKTEPIDPDDEVIPQTNQNPVGMDYWNAQTAMSGESRVSTSSVMTTPTLVKQLQNNFVSGLQNISIPNTHAVTGSSVSVGTPVGATDTGGIATVMPGSKQNALSLKMIGNKLYFVLPCNMNVPLQPVSPNTSVTQAVQITPVQNVSVNTGAPANAFISPQTIDVPEPAVNTSVQNVVLSKVGLHASKTLQTVVTSNIGLAANTQVPMINALPGPAANTTNVGLVAHSIFPAQNLVVPQTTGQRSGRMSPPCVEPSAKRQKMDSNVSVSPQISNSNQHALSKIDSNPGFSVTNTSAVYGDGTPRVASTTMAKSLQKNDTKSTSPVPCSSKTSMSLRRGASSDGGPTSADEQVCDEDDDNVDDDENKDDDEGGAENTTEMANDLAAPGTLVACEVRKRFRPVILGKTEDLSEPRHSTSTIRNTSWGLKIFQDWSLETTGQHVNLSTVSIETLAEALQKFYCEARPRCSDAIYQKTTLVNIRAAINRYLSRLNRDIDIVRDKEFRLCNSMLEVVSKQRALEIPPKPALLKTVIEPSDLKKISTYLEGAPHCPIILRRCVWFYISMHFIIRSIEFHRHLKPDSFRFHNDESGEYVTLSPEMEQKNFEGSWFPKREHLVKRMHALPDKKICPVRMLKLLLKKTEKNSTRLFNRYNKLALSIPSETDIWFSSKPLSVRSFSTFFFNICQAAGVKEKYVPLCLRATAVQYYLKEFDNMTHVVDESLK